MARPASRHDDQLFRRVRRSVARARRFAPDREDRRLALVLIAELRAEIEALQAGLQAVENEMKASTRRVTAATAYNRCAALIRR
ncbi:hypothetical protein JQ557_23330 [Bradyrhizobium sp. U87765 SZCCT0131]|uniref:hypothetical protein n=1 Tax=unclassified Bradyrhizobium TaxID=2631580 RepID=UPI001BA91E99|nr:MULTISPECIES: hypothetical protein [unclassified Bradyrhizobium]MBR1220951.1 hypothetical protein [Bradyrhizobium sp. U87765 SZCCT0131]MBR1260229.1 hypothetical protein [Bradyrhizobium sp. U87765 SZCCT0134]MBR1307522.1 hypothetical protein [Bradyrhizobium sp. U87765 SZCCT0110]MBR1321476.1 hypothetical protein [Bradyrhizobium sp. U87765 SZCCT0109]MBR1349789.1 hypothetical protein [Bradyrhizobium sp. U87765 SZCCT0048]